MRYVGQGHEIPVALPARPLTPADLAGLRAVFDAEYARFYDRPVPGTDVEVMSYALLVTTSAGEDAGAVLANARVRPGNGAPRSQSVRDTASGEVGDWPVYDRRALETG